MQQAAEDSIQEEMIENPRVKGLDLRGTPPSKEWLQLVSTSPEDVAVRAYVKENCQRLALVLGRQDLSWSGESLWLAGAVLDRLLTHIHVSADALSSHRGPSMLNEEIIASRALRREAAKLRRAEYLKLKAQVKGASSG